MHQEVLLQEQRGSVRILTFNRPERLNAWNDELEDAYFAALDDADDDSAVRAVVVTGAGRGFCSGADLADLARVRAGELPRERAVPRHRPMAFRKPLIAAVNGAAAGLGLVEAMFCDIRFATPTAKLLSAFSHRGLIAEYGVAWLLPRIVGWSRAADLLLSGRTVLGDEAHRLGLVDFLAEPDDLLDTAVGYASAMTDAASPWSMAIIKQQLAAAAEETLSEAIERADALMRDSFLGDDVKEGVLAYERRRRPNFAPLPPRGKRRELS